MEPLQDVIRRRRGALGLSQAGLAEAAGVHLRQIRRYESGEQQPVLAVGARLAAALGVSVDELAGVATAALEGGWWVAWQTFSSGAEVIALQPVELTQHGTSVEIEAVGREGARRAAWHGELRLWNGRTLTGWYTADGGPRSRGTMFFVLADGGGHAEGRWVGLSYEGAVVTGVAVLARTRERAQAVVNGVARRVL